MDTHSTINKYRAIGLILIIIGIVYSNTLDADWHFDDYNNILENPWVHIRDLYPQSIKQTFFASFDNGYYRGENLYRPVAMASFAVNWYFGQKDVTGYHVVNISVHMLAALFLFLCVATVLTTPRVKEKYGNSRYSIALLAAVLWAVHPIQVQGVTYIVQRMASMAGMFYIASFYTYLKARIIFGYGKKMVLFSVCLLLFVLAILSKQNAVLLPLIIVAAELIFFRNPDKTDIKKMIMAGGGLIFVFAITAVVMLYFDRSNLSFLEQYSSRSFSLLQRLMTEPRVIWYYLYQLIYPIASNFSISHSTIVSTSLISPWTTLPAIVSIFASFGAAIFFARRFPLICFAVLFFLINHLVESTFIPLELVFEHRNYIPSMFLFVPVAAGIQTTLAKYRELPDKRFLFRVYTCLVTGIIMVTAIGAYARNFDWRSEKSLWQDAVIKAPDRARSYLNLAVAYYLKIHDYETAIKMFEKSLDLEGNSPQTEWMISYANLSQIYVRLKDLEKARQYAKKAVEANPKSISYMNYISVLLESDMLDDALYNAEQFLENEPENKDGIEFKTIILIRKGEFEKAEKSALALIKREPFTLKYLIYFGLVQSRLKRYEKAEYYLKKVVDKNGKGPEQIALYLTLVDNSIMAGDQKKTDDYLEQLFQQFVVFDIKKALNRMQTEAYPMYLISSPETVNRVRSYLENMAQTISVKTNEDPEKSPRTF